MRSQSYIAIGKIMTGAMAITRQTNAGARPARPPSRPLVVLSNSAMRPPGRDPVFKLDTTRASHESANILNFDIPLTLPANCLFQERQCTPGKLPHVGLPVRSLRLESAHLFSRSRNCEACMTRIVSITVSRRTGRTGFRQSPSSTNVIPYGSREP